MIAVRTLSCSHRFKVAGRPHCNLPTAKLQSRLIVSRDVAHTQDTQSPTTHSCTHLIACDLRTTAVIRINSYCRSHKDDLSLLSISCAWRDRLAWQESRPSSALSKPCQTSESRVSLVPPSKAQHMLAHACAVLHGPQQFACCGPQQCFILLPFGSKNGFGAPALSCAGPSLNVLVTQCRLPVRYTICSELMRAPASVARYVEASSPLPYLAADA